MATQLAKRKPVDRFKVEESADRPTEIVHTNVASHDRRSAAARGIALAVLISIPFWGLIAFAIYLLR